MGLVLRRGRDNVTILFLPTVDATVQDQAQRRAVVMGNLVRVGKLLTAGDGGCYMQDLWIHTFQSPVDGKWSEWSSWEECSRSCGHGNRTRVRTCSNPSPQHSGKPCEGSAVEVIVCSVQPCPGKRTNVLLLKVTLYLLAILLHIIS